MTKEEIIERNNSRDFKELGDKVNNSITTFSAALASMEEYAKQEAIAFSRWATRKLVKELHVVEWDYTDEELYDLYLKQKAE